MKEKITLFFIFCLGYIYVTGEEIPYEIKAFDGTIFACCHWTYNSYSVGCDGIIIDCDTIILETDNQKNFFHSLFKNEVYATGGELEFAHAYHIIFPQKDEFMNNYKLAEKLRIDFFDLCSQTEKSIELKLATSGIVQIWFNRVKGLFLSIYDEDLAKQFSTSADVDKELMPPLDSVNILVSYLECTESDHKFFIKDAVNPEPDLISNPRR